VLRPGTVEAASSPTPEQPSTLPATQPTARGIGDNSLADLAARINAEHAVCQRSTEIDRATALELLRRGRLLVREYTTAGVRWSINPGGFLVAGRVARQLIQFANIEPVDRGFWAGLEQSWRWG
jgi:hypothetical protein